MKKILYLSFALVLIFTMILTGCQPSATTSNPPATTTPYIPYTEPVTLTFAYHAPSQSSLARALIEPWAADIEKASEGKIKITRYPGATLVKASDAYDAVATGLCDIAQVDTEETPGRFPVAGLNSLYFFMPSTSVAGIVSHEILNKYAVNNELKEVKLLNVVALHPAQWFGTKQAKVLTDLKGLRIRASGQIESSCIDALGGVPVNLSTADLSSALDKGTVDGCFFTYSGSMAFALRVVSTNCTEANAQVRSHLFLMNKDKYNKLPTDLKKIIDQFATPEVSLKYNQLHEAALAEPRGMVATGFEMDGSPIYVLPEDERAKWKAAVKPAWDQWVKDVTAKGIDGAAVMIDTLALIEKYNK